MILKIKYKICKLWRWSVTWRHHWVELHNNNELQWYEETGKLSASQACRAEEWERGEEFRCADTVIQIRSVRPISTYRRGAVLQELEKSWKTPPRICKLYKVKFTALLSFHKRLWNKNAHFPLMQCFLKCEARQTGGNLVIFVPVSINSFIYWPYTQNKTTTHLNANLT